MQPQPFDSIIFELKSLEAAIAAINAQPLGAELEEANRGKAAVAAMEKLRTSSKNRRGRAPSE